MKPSMQVTRTMGKLFLMSLLLNLLYTYCTQFIVHLIASQILVNTRLGQSMVPIQRWPIIPYEQSWRSFFIIFLTLAFKKYIWIWCVQNGGHLFRPQCANRRIPFLKAQWVTSSTQCVSIAVSSFYVIDTLRDKTSRSMTTGNLI